MYAEFSDAFKKGCIKVKSFDGIITVPTTWKLERGLTWQLNLEQKDELGILSLLEKSIIAREAESGEGITLQRLEENWLGRTEAVLKLVNKVRSQLAVGDPGASLLRAMLPLKSRRLTYRQAFALVEKILEIVGTGPYDGPYLPNGLRFTADGGIAFEVNPFAPDDIQAVVRKLLAM